MDLYSVLITSYECHGDGLQFIKDGLESIISQIYRPIQCVISDHSKDDIIENYVKSVSSNGVDIVYVRYSENYGSPSCNLNNAAKYSSGKYIHHLALDCKLSSPDSVEKIISYMNANSSKWIACSHICIDNPSGYSYTFVPRWNNNVLSSNTLSGIGAIVIHESLKHVLYDPQFIWFLDLDWYYRLWLEAGEPNILADVTWVNVSHKNQLTNTICDTARQNIESERMYAKYGNPLPLS